MGFEDLELRLIEEGSYTKYFEDLAKVKRKPIRSSAEHAEMIRYFLSINHAAETNGQGNNTYTVGGYAIMSYLVAEFGEEILNVWRGSHDVDLVATDQTVLSVIMGSFDQRIQRLSHIPDKYSLEVKDKHTELADLICEVDLYRCWNGRLRINQREICDDFLNGAEHLRIYGINVSVPSITQLIKLKLDVQTYERHLRPKDRIDIVDLISILINRKVSPLDLYKEFTDKENEVLVNEVFQSPGHPKKHIDLPAPTVSELNGKKHFKRDVNEFAAVYTCYHDKKKF